MKEIRISLDEPKFTNVCKFGHILVNDEFDVRHHVNITKKDMRILFNGDILDKEVSQDLMVRIKVEGVDTETLIEVIKRSPVFDHEEFK
jgi:hypothetical protein